MVGCDNCDKWFHGSCMNIDKAASDTLTKWICPPCMGKGSALPSQMNGAKSSATDKPLPVMELSTVIHSISPHAPDPVTLWPPLGLRSSSSAVEALGKMGESDNEDFVKEARGSKGISRSNVYTIAQKKDNVALTSSLKSGVGFKSGVSTAAGQKTEKPNSITLSSSKITAKSSVQKGAIKIPGQPRQTQPLLLPTAKPTAGSAALKSVILSSLHVTKSSTGPKIAAKTVIPPTSVIKSLAAQVKTSSLQKQLNNTAEVKNVVNKPAVTNVHVAGSKVEPFNGVSSVRQGTVKSNPSKHLVLPRDSIRTEAQTATSKLIPGSTAKASGASTKFAVSVPSDKVTASLPRVATTLNAGSPIKYPKPDSGAVKVVNRNETVMNGAGVTVKSTSAPTMPNQVCASKQTPTAPGIPGKETTYPSKTSASVSLNGSTPSQSNSDAKPSSH